jgi:hypothetical protein
MLTIFRTGESGPVVLFGIRCWFAADAVGSGVDFRLDLAAPLGVFLGSRPCLIEDVAFGESEAVSTERGSLQFGIHVLTVIMLAMADET